MDHGPDIGMQTDDVMARAVLAAVLFHAPVLVIRFDAAQRVTFTNTYAQRMLGSALRERTLAALLMEFSTAIDLRALLAQPEATHMLTLRTAAGVPESFMFRFFPVADETLAVGYLDVQEQRRLQDEVLLLNQTLNNLTRQLQQANAELRDLNQLKNVFLGMAAHDLRKPLGVIMSYTDFVLDEASARLTTEQCGFLTTCQNAAAGMQRLIDDFLDVTMIESGALRIEPAPVCIAAIIANVLQLARLLAAKKNVTLHVPETPDAWRIMADGPKLEQVILNLVSNAIEYSRPGQHVWLSTRWEPPTLTLAVCDEGPGIAPADQACLFTAFARTGERKTAGERSVGLGLVIARKIIEAHHGRIWVESVPGHGATFSFTVPLNASGTPTPGNHG